MKYFTIKELCNSVTAKARGIDNTPSSTIVEHLTELIDNILDPLRESWGSGIKVTSGYRCEKLNKAVGGSTTSAHNAGYAADIVPVNGKITEFKAYVLKWLKDNNIPYDQYINEFSGTSQWVHIAIMNRQGKQRKQNLLYKNNKYTRI